MPTPDPLDPAAEKARLRALLTELVATGAVSVDNAQRLDEAISSLLARVTTELLNAETVGRVAAATARTADPGAMAGG
jgi:hypothetical protein